MQLKISLEQQINRNKREAGVTDSMFSFEDLLAVHRRVQRSTYPLFHMQDFIRKQLLGAPTRLIAADDTAAVATEHHHGAMRCTDSRRCGVLASAQNPHSKRAEPGGETRNGEEATSEQRK
jgi:hypothetical protein